MKAKIERSGRNDLDNAVELPNASTNLEIILSGVLLVILSVLWQVTGGML